MSNTDIIVNEFDEVVEVRSDTKTYRAPHKQSIKQLNADLYADIGTYYQKSHTRAALGKLIRNYGEGPPNHHADILRINAYSQLLIGANYIVKDVTNLNEKPGSLHWMYSSIVRWILTYHYAAKGLEFFKPTSAKSNRVPATMHPQVFKNSNIHQICLKLISCYREIKDVNIQTKVKCMRRNMNLLAELNFVMFTSRNLKYTRKNKLTRSFSLVSLSNNTRTSDQTVYTQQTLNKTFYCLVFNVRAMYDLYKTIPNATKYYVGDLSNITY